MTMNNNEISLSGERNEKPHSGKAMQRIKFYAVVSIMSLLCFGFI